jgi:Domain of unknown function (DUF1707)
MSLIPEPHELRASDAEREAVVEALRAHAAAGRLDPDELEQRIERTYAARTRADLVPVVADLPESGPRRPSDDERRQGESGRHEPRRALALVPIALVALVLVAIWALTGGGYFWVAWPVGAMLLGAFKHRRFGGYERGWHGRIAGHRQFGCAHGRRRGRPYAA